jgi:pimeloyl-ACP methyl ester carboxylesterase
MLSNVKTADLVTHDIGNMVGYALAAGYPGRISKWVAIDAPLPGVGHWAEQLSNPKLSHFNFHGPDEERLVTGRERIYLDRFWNELSGDPSAIDEATRQHYADLYARPHAIHDAFEQFVAFPQTASTTSPSWPRASSRFLSWRSAARVLSAPAWPPSSLSRAT